MEDNGDKSPIALKIEQADKLAREQQERLNNMTPDQRKGWKFDFEDAKRQAEEDEKENPSAK
jgi:hypothetical protein